MAHDVGWNFFLPTTLFIYAHTTTATALGFSNMGSVTRKNSPNVYKSCPKMISLLQKMPINVGDLGKLIVAKGFKKLPKGQ